MALLLFVFGIHPAYPAYTGHEPTERPGKPWVKRLPDAYPSDGAVRGCPERCWF